MPLTPWILLLSAIALAYPLPIILSRAVWSVKAPMLALFAWQAVALAGGLSMIGAFLTYGLAPLAEDAAAPNSLPALTAKAFTALFGPEETALRGGVFGVWHLIALTVAALLSLHLLLHLFFSYYQLRQERLKHQNLLNIIATRETVDGSSTQILVIGHDAPLAYWLPLGIMGPAPLPIVSRGLLDKLTAPQLEAVIAHEKAHIKQRHDLLQWAFSAWKSALPWLPTAQKAWISVVSLIEIVADNRALKTVPAKDLETVLHYLDDERRFSVIPFETSSHSMLNYRKARLRSRQCLHPAVKAVIGVSACLLLTATILLVLFPTVL